MKKGIAFFDFDGTITTKDTLLEFIKYSSGILPFYTGFLLTSPYLVAFKLKVYSNQKAKEKVFRYFFKNMPIAKFDELCRRFAVERLPSLLRPKALEEIKQLKDKGVNVVVVSASPENWIKYWTDAMGITLIGTRLETKNNLITGMIQEKNCHGAEKVERINKMYNITEYEDIFAYGDSNGDKPMLALANHPFYKPFRH